MSTRVYSVDANAPTGGWSTTTANFKCGEFSPTDAVYQQITINSPGGVNGYDKVYYSASLANQFPASSFTDSSQNQVKAGLFDVEYLYTDSTDTAIDDCNVEIGTAQENG